MLTYTFVDTLMRMHGDLSTMAYGLSNVRLPKPIRLEMHPAAYIELIRTVPPSAVTNGIAPTAYELYGMELQRIDRNFDPSEWRIIGDGNGAFLDGIELYHFNQRDGLLIRPVITQYLTGDPYLVRSPK